MKGSDICGVGHCTGCGACESLCPHRAIAMRADWRGFLRPHVSAELCIDCGLCRQRCPAAAPDGRPFTMPPALGFIDGHDERWRRAASGGAFGVVAREVLARGGVVFRAAQTDDLHVRFTAADSEQQLATLHGSKYTQAEPADVYRRVGETLRQGRQAFFCGCPCQVAALKAYLHGREEGLLTADLICHGVTAQPTWRASALDAMRRSGANAYRFRAKTDADGNPPEGVYVGWLSNGAGETVHADDWLMRYFLWGVGCQPGCYHCRHAGAERPGDITLGDLGQLPSPDWSGGASVVLLNTPKGRALRGLFEAAGRTCQVTSPGQAQSGDGGQLCHPSRSNARTGALHALFRLFGTSGPRALLALDLARLRLMDRLRGR